MSRFPRDAPQPRVIKALQRLGFELVSVRNHIKMIRRNPDGTSTPLTMPNHRTIYDVTLRLICNQCGISRDEFLAVYEKK